MSTFLRPPDGGGYPTGCGPDTAALLDRRVICDLLGFDEATYVAKNGASEVDLTPGPFPEGKGSPCGGPHPRPLSTK